MQISLSDHFTYQKLLRFVAPSILMMIITSIWYKISIAPEAYRKPRRLCLFLL